MKQELLIGTYSKNGIYKLGFKNNNLFEIMNNNILENCSSILVNSQNIYGIVEYSDRIDLKNGYLSSFDLNLSFINGTKLLGSGPCFVNYDKIHNLIFVANYSDGSIDVLSLDNNGSILNTIYHKAFSAHSKIHHIAFNSDYSQVFFTDLNDFKLYTFKINFENNIFSLTNSSFYSFQNNCQPRHIAVNNNLIYIVTENTAELYKLSFSNDANFQLLEKLSLLPKNIPMQSNYTGCAIKISNDKKFLYTSIRGHNSISVFNIENNFSLIQNISCFGITPRDLCLSIDENYLFCANQNSNNISIFKRNKKTGFLQFSNIYSITAPACIINL